jgi:hypothetical protein
MATYLEDGQGGRSGNLATLSKEEELQNLDIGAPSKMAKVANSLSVAILIALGHLGHLDGALAANWKMPLPGALILLVERTISPDINVQIFLGTTQGAFGDSVLFGCLENLC